MDRPVWLKEKRRITEERFDTLWAPLYDEKWGAYSNAAHLQIIQIFLGLLPQHSIILDAACGTGRYWPMLLDQEHTVVGIDQSQGMLSRAKIKFPTVQVEKVGMQEILYQEAFDGIICMDAMEYVFPEDYPLILRNFYRGLRPDGHLYFTVEILDERKIEHGFTVAQQMGLPVVYGEMAHEEGYHYYPKMEQVKKWAQHAGFGLINETVGDEYHHFILQKE